MPGGRGTGPNGCCCRLCPNLPTPVLGRQFEGSVGVYQSNPDRTFTNVENDSPSPVLVNDIQFSRRLEWRQDDLFLLCANPSHDGTLAHPANNFTLYRRDPSCTKILIPIMSPDNPGSSGVDNSVDWTGNYFGFSNGPLGYMFANDMAVAVGVANTAGGGTIYNPATVNSPSGWTNVAGVKGSSSFATASGGQSNIIATAFGFSIPTIPSSCKIVNVVLAIDHHSDVSNNTKDLTVYFTKDGSTTVGSNLAQTSAFWTVASETYQYQTAGTTWTPAEINASTFGVIFNCTTTGVASVQNFRIIVTFTVDGSQVYTVSSSAPNRIAVMPHSTGTIMCFSGDDFVIAPPGKLGSSGSPGFGASATTYSGAFVYSFDGASFTLGTIGTITLPSSNTFGWICQSARFAQDQNHCGFVLASAQGVSLPSAPFYFYTATRIGTSLNSPTQLTFTSDIGGRTAVGDVWAISPDGSLLAFRANNGGSPDYVHIYSGGSLAQSFKASNTNNSESIYQLSFSDDGKQLAAAQYGVDNSNIIHGRVCVWDISGTTFTESSQPVPVAQAMGVAFTHGYRVPA